MSGIIDTLFWNETLQPYLDEQVKKAHPNQDAKKAGWWAYRAEGSMIEFPYYIGQEREVIRISTEQLRSLYKEFLQGVIDGD